MEDKNKNLAEHSDSLDVVPPTTEDNVDTDTPAVPDNADAKPDGETEKPADADHVPGEAEEENKEEATVEVPPETPPPGLEKVSEDIDQFLVSHEASSEIPVFVERFLDLAEEKIARYDTGEAKFGEIAEEDSLLLEAVSRVSKLVKSVSAESDQEKEEKEETEEENEKKEVDKKKCSNKDLLVNRIGAIHQRAMSYLEEEFRLIMEECRKESKTEPGGGSSNDPKGKHVAAAEPSDSEAVETVTNFPGFPEEAVTSLNKIARELISGGYESECCHVYAISRKHAFEESLRRFGYEKISADEVHKMQWEALEREIPTWINTFKECSGVWLPGERKLADSVFVEHPNTGASLYGSLSRGVVVQLLNFAESVAITKRAGEKLFKLLDIYEALRDAIPNLENLFPEDIVDEVKSEMTTAKNRLGEAAVLIFCELENSIKSETGRTPVAGGAVHPLTRYIMNYLRLACEYKDTLEEVFKEHSKIERKDSTSRPHYEEGEQSSSNNNNNNKDNQKPAASPFATQLMRVMELLDTNLEGKAKLYKEVALSCIFMMNNGRYIVQKIKGSSEIYQVMGETWTRKRSSELRTYHKNYQIETWSKILGCLSPKGLNDNGKVQKPALKERFKTFNTLFEEIHKTQSSWVVSDEQLQSELRVSISALVIPAYRSFLGRFSQYLDAGRQTEKYIKYQADDIETYIDELFDGNPHHQANARKKA